MQNRQSESQSELKTRLFNFLHLSAFVLSTHRIQSQNNEVELLESRPSVHMRVANLFDKSFIKWSLDMWQEFDSSKDEHGIMLITWLLREIITIDTTLRIGSQHDRFVCQALASIFFNDGGILELYRRSIRQYNGRSHEHCLKQLVEGVHICISLSRRLKSIASENHERDYAISFPQECGQSIKHSIFCDEHIIRNHIWLLEDFDANEDALNLSIISFLQLVSFHGHDKYLHKLSNMKTMYQVAGGKLFFTTLLQEDQHSFVIIFELQIALRERWIIVVDG